MTWQELPAGMAPKPVHLPHFPARWQAVLWRNWGLVQAERLAAVLETDAETLRRAADALGLDPVAPLQEKWTRHSYLSVIRKNWHLLSFRQILALLEWSPEQMSRTLFEEDFFWSKMGRLKPDTGDTVFRPLSPEEAERTGRIREIMRRHFPAGRSGYIEKPFDFAEHYELPPPVRGKTSSGFEFNMIHSYAAGCGDVFGEAEKADPVPEDLLARYAALGVKGVWFHALLRRFYPIPGAEEFSQGRELRLKNLKKIAERCRKYGIGVYLYFNEPRSMPMKFYEKKTEWGGWVLPDGSTMTICTSRTEEPLRWLEQGIRFLFSEVPELAGLFCITMSENPTNCGYSSHREQCPYCAGVPQEKIIADIVSAMERGMHSVNPEAKMIAYDWAWRPFKQSQENVPFKTAVLNRLPPAVCAASVSEWGKITRIGGVSQYLKDYSLSQPGPSPEALGTWEAARKRGMKTAAKIQINNSWELSAVPSLPVPFLIHEHLQNLRKTGISGLILSWTLGGYPGGNLLLLNASPEEIAAARFHPELAEKVCRVWKQFSEAFRNFPFHNFSVLYKGPQNYGPANLLHAEKTGFEATMLGFPYDDLETWRGPYPEEVLEEQFRKMTEGWKEGLELLEAGEMPRNAEEEKEYRDLCILGKASWCHLRSAFCQIRFVRAKQQGDRQVMRECVLEERSLALMLHELVRRDSRLGFEASNHYFYSLNDLQEKVISCEQLLETL